MKTEQIATKEAKKTKLPLGSDIALEISYLISLNLSLFHDFTLINN